MKYLVPLNASALSLQRSWKHLALAAGFLLCAIPDEASAHLSIIRQGRESAGVPVDGDKFGQVVTAGDFNGDGFEDLATSAPLDDTVAGTVYGSVVINWGTEVGLTHENAQFIPAESAVFHAFSFFGSALTNADFNQDGYDDLVVGVPEATVGPIFRNGLVAVYYGGPTGVNPVPFIQTQALLGHSPMLNSYFGASVAVGDLDDDGFPDLVIGSPGHDGSRGAVYWMYSDATGLTTAGAERATQATYGTPGQPGDQFGYSVAVGQLAGAFGGSNPNDIAVGIPFKGSGFLFSIPDTGGVAILEAFGSAGPSPNTADLYTPAGLGLILAAEPNGRFGFSLATGNVVPGSHENLVVGRPGLNNSQGEVALLQGSSSSMSLVDTYDSSDFGITPTDFDLFGHALDCGDWDADGTDDVVVGSAGNTAPTTTLNNAGRVYLYRGGLTGMTVEDHWGQSELGETPLANFQLGFTVCFGLFDDSGRANIAAGAPGTIKSGQVHIIAPWRQIMGLHCDTSVALNCDDDMVFSQKPFEPIFLASTTKTMTILIACERTQLPTNHPDYVNPNSLYTVPDWVANDIWGSQFNLVPGERMSLFDLMAMTMAVSGNDCAYAIADMLTGGGATFVDIFNVVPTFVSEMNTRAQALGLLDTSFTNPAGYSPAEPESTAYDMALLSRVAMNNPLFAGIVGTSQWQVTRLFPDGGGGFVPIEESVDHRFVPTLKNRLPEATGVKSGTTTAAQITGVFSARHNVFPWGTVVASSFHTTLGYGNAFFNEGAALLRLGLDECDVIFDYAPAPSDEIGPLVQPGISADINKEGITKAPPPDPEGPVTKVEVHGELAPGDSTSVLMEISRLSEVTLKHNNALNYQVSNVTGHEGITIFNQTESTQITLSVITNIPGVSPLFVQIKGGESLVIAPAALPAVGDFILTLTALVGIGNEAQLTVTENYEETVNVGNGPAPAMFAMDFTSPGAQVTEHLITTKITGLDTTLGRTVGLVVRGDDPGYLYEPGLAQMDEYGSGWAGTAGVPILKSDDLPVLGGSFDLLMGNSLLADTAALWNIGFNPLSFQTTLGGTVLVQKFVTVPLMLPAAGLEFTLGVPADPSFLGVSFFHQIYLGDPGASDGIAFSRGLEMKVGL